MKTTLSTVLLSVLLASSAASSEATPNRWDQVAVDWITKNYALDPQSCTVELLSNPLKTPHADDLAVDFRALSQKEPSGLFTVLATVSRGGQTIETGQIRTRIHRYASVLVTTDKVKRGERIDPKNVAVQRTEITNLTEKPVTSLEETVGYRVRRNIRCGRIVTTAALEPIPDIESGRETLIVYDNGLCRVTAPGVALQSGSTGDYIKVKNKATKKILVARVIDENAVAVDP
ncbi:MAG: flagellar basal body P-ring formation protein FlgA [Candidatus Zixiibacteriota bacterium]|nr:MAG: flagellar basal body P-ring formation protein FlgA [candidate division Zixibacteria bacterium]